MVVYDIIQSRPHISLEDVGLALYYHDDFDQNHNINSYDHAHWSTQLTVIDQPQKRTMKVPHEQHPHYHTNERRKIVKPISL